MYANSSVAKGHGVGDCRPADLGSQSTVFSDLIGERSIAGETSACRIARYIEQEIVAGGISVDDNWGSEKALAARFGVSRSIMRQAGRVLEIRGVARMQRGPKGGLKVLALDHECSADIITYHMRLFAPTPADIDAAQLVLEEIAKKLARKASYLDEIGSSYGQQKDVVDFYLRIVNSLKTDAIARSSRQESSSVQLYDLFRRTRAGQIVKRMMSEYSPQDWVEGRRLGSEEELCEKYAADRDVFRQVVRIFESTGAAKSVCGRGNGLVSQAPRLGATCRLIACDLAIYGIEPDSVFDLFNYLSVQTAGIAAARATSEDREKIEDALARFAAAIDGNGMDQQSAALFKVEECLYSVAGNPIILLFLLGTKGFSASNVSRTQIEAAHMNQKFLECTRQVVEALRRNDPFGAMRAQYRKNIVLSSPFIGRSR